MHIRAALLFLLLCIVFPIAHRGQDGDDKDDVIKITTQLVDVPVAVINPDGSAARALKASNFVVYEDGKRQEIADFSTVSEPFEVALLLDTSGSTRSDLQVIQRAALDFISGLRAGDRVAIVAFRTDREAGGIAVPDVVSQLTNDRVALRNAVQNIKTSNGTPLYDSMLEVVEKVFEQRPSEQYRGRRAMVALTDGVDSTSSADFLAVKERLGELGIIAFFIKVDTQEYFEETLLGDCATAIRFSNAQIKRYYRSIGVRGSVEKAANFCQLGDFERLAVSKKLYQLADSEMTLLAKTSGGKVFPADDLSNARNAFKSVAAEIGTKYTLGYYPTNEKRDGSYRKIRVEVKGLPAGTQVRARDGYTAPRQ